METIRKANKKTMMQVGKGDGFTCDKDLRDGIEVSVSLMGMTYAQSLSSSQIRDSFKKAFSSAEKL